MTVVSALTFAIGALVGTVAPASATDYSSPFGLTVGATTWDYTYEEVGGQQNLCSMYSSGINGGFKSEPGNHYSTYYMYVPVSGDYEYTDFGPGDMVAAVYSLGLFDPTAPTINCLAAGDETSNPDWSLSEGWYTIVVSSYAAGGSGPFSFTLTGPGSVVVSDTAPLGSTSTQDLTIWQQATARKIDEACNSGWWPSWMQWPNDGTGGYVCVRNIYAYFPNGILPD